jgi:hypothetical protein
MNLCKSEQFAEMGKTALMSTLSLKIVAGTHSLTVQLKKKQFILNCYLFWLLSIANLASKQNEVGNSIY